LGILADRQGRILHRPLDLATGDTRANQDDETNNGDEGVKTGVIAHHRPRTFVLLSWSSSRPIVAPRTFRQPLNA
jgi:hypothetical protein